MKLDRKVSTNKWGEKVITLGGVLDIGVNYGVLVAPGALRFSRSKNPSAYIYSPASANLTGELPNMAGFTTGSVVRVSILPDGDILLFDPKEFKGLEAFARKSVYSREIDALAVPPSARKDARDASIRRVGAKLNRKAVTYYATLQKNELDSLQLKSGDEMVATYRHIGNSRWIELRKARPIDKEIIPLQNCYGITVNQEYRGFSYRFKLFDNRFYVPAQFCVDNKAVVAAKSAKSTIWCGDGVIVIEAPISTCGVCGEEVHSTAPHSHACACPDCAKHLGNGNIIGAMSNTLSEIEEMRKMK